MENRASCKGDGNNSLSAFTVKNPHAISMVNMGSKVGGLVCPGGDTSHQRLL